ncbi:MAG: metal-dependent hydrolase, partial [Candidatus Binatia bacterium]
MDPITQGLLGGVAAQSLYRKPVPRFVPWVAAVSAMTPDLDLFIRSKEDPLLVFEYHRQFTHSLVFIPFGAAFLAF